MVDDYIFAFMMYSTVANKTFIFQDGFIDTWRNTEYDLMRFSKGQLELIRSLIRELLARAFPKKLLDAVRNDMTFVLEERRQGNISSADWQQYGAKLAIGWALAVCAKDREANTTIAEARQGGEATRTVAKKATAEAAAAAVGGNVLRQVPWNSPLLRSLLKPVGEVREPAKVIKNKQLVRPHGKEWMTADTFIKILKTSKFQQDMDGLSGDLEHMMVSAKQARDNEDMEMEG